MLIEKMQLEDDEKVLAIIRKHWWIIFVNCTGLVLLALLPGLFAWFLLTLFTNAGFATEVATSWAETNQGVLWYGYTLWLLILWMALGNFWTDYYLDVWVVTNRRVILVDQRGFFSRFLSSFRLERLQDMNIDVSGILATLLDFGTIEAQTAGGSNEQFRSTFMPKPRDIKALIVRSADELTKEQAARVSDLKAQGL
jgi:uncharacterized membrane protein YdbT with pleckstrin-like domain